MNDGHGLPPSEFNDGCHQGLAADWELLLCRGIRCDRRADFRTVSTAGQQRFTDPGLRNPLQENGPSIRMTGELAQFGDGECIWFRIAGRAWASVAGTSSVTGSPIRGQGAVAGSSVSGFQLLRVGHG